MANRATAEEAAKQRIAKVKVDTWSLAKADELREEAMKHFDANHADAQAALTQVARFIAPRQREEKPDGGEKSEPKTRRSRTPATAAANETT